MIDAKVVDGLIAERRRAESSPLAELTPRELMSIGAYPIWSIILLAIDGSSTAWLRTDSRTSRRSLRHDRMGRHTASRVLVVLGTLVALVAILAVWVGRQALETDQWTDTSSQLLQESAVQTAVAGYLVDQLYANVDVAGELRAALPERAQPLAAPAAGALRNAAEDVAQRALDRPRVQAAWEAANRQAHELLVQVIEGGGDVVGTEQGVVTLDLKALLDEIAQRTGVGGRLADRLPASAASIVIVRSDQLSTIQSIGNALKPLALVLVLLALALFGAAIALAPGNRRETLRACGIGFVLAGIGALVVRKLAGQSVVDELATTAAVRPAVQSAWTIGTSLLVDVAVATIAYGALIVAGAWLAGPTGVATAARRGMAPYLRDWRIAYGAVAAIVLLVLLWGPTEGTRRLLPALVLVALFVAGVELLRRQTVSEFPDAVRGGSGGFGALVERAREAVAARREARPAADDGHGAAAAPLSAAVAPSASALEAEREAVVAVGERTAAVNDSAVDQLERLSELHRSGALDDEEFAAAKRRVLTPA